VASRVEWFYWPRSTEKEPLISAEVVSLICADLRTDGSVNQRSLLLRKTNRTITVKSYRRENDDEPSLQRLSDGTEFKELVQSLESSAG
jgi:hypothetical protein